MFGFLKKKNDARGVLANLKTVTQWFKTLPAGDIYSVQEEVVQQLDAFNKEAPDFSKDRLLVLMYLDEATREMQSLLCMQYLRNSRLSTTIEAKLRTAILSFYTETTRAYHNFLIDFVTNPATSRIKEYIPLITARAIRGFSDIIKWHYFRFDSPDEKLWLWLHNVYRIAEFDTFSGTEVQVYADDRGKRSPTQEYGRALLLSLFGNGTLAAKDLELVNQWLHSWSPQIRVDNHCDPDSHLFYVDTAEGMGLRRCRKLDQAPTYRYISTKGLLDTIHHAEEALKAGKLPASLGLTEDFRLPGSLTLLHQVSKEWAQLEMRNRRAHPRVAQTGSWLVIYGLSNISTQLARSEMEAETDGQSSHSPEELLDIKLYGFVTKRNKREHQNDAAGKASQEIWEQTDASEGGLGFIVRKASQSEWLKAGRLVAICPMETKKVWQLAVITRLVRKVGGERHIGVRLIIGTFHCISLTPDESDMHMAYVVNELDHGSNDQDTKALLLTEGDGNEKLLIERVHYALDRLYVIYTPLGRQRRVRLLGVEVAGESWVKVGIENLDEPEPATTGNWF